MIQTVLGNIEKDNINWVLPHEHVFSDLRSLVEPIDNGIFYDKVSLENYGELSRNPYAVLDNAWLSDKEAAVSELLRVKKAGCDIFVDVTTEDFGRDPQFLKELSKKTGVHIVMGCGNYIEASVSAENKGKSVEEMKKKIIAELTEGVDGTGIKAGVIGEVGSSDKIYDNEKKFLQAAAEAQAETGFGMHIHACLWNRTGLEALDYAVNHGANPEKICIDHADVLLDEKYIFGILDRGAYMEFDNIGKEFYVDRKNRNLLLGSFAHDTERVKMIKKIIEKGYIKQILISNDICLKSMMHKYGGWGYDHLSEHFVPMMEDFGISDTDIKTMIRENPLRFIERSTK